MLAAAMAAILAALLLAGCGQQSGAADASGTPGATEATDTGLYYTQQEVRTSPEWVTKLDAAKDTEQLIVVAGYPNVLPYCIAVLATGYVLSLVQICVEYFIIPRS